jgi:hypothetical protein
MSSVFSMPVRERWASREVIVERWHVQPGGTFRYNDPIVELRVDGVPRVLVYEERHYSDPEGGAYRHYVNEGEEVGPWGYLLEYTDWLASSPGPPPRRGGPSPSRFRRRDNYPRVFLNYRRDDADAYAGRLHETLSKALGPDDVFMDQFSIRPGEIFSWTIQQAVWHASVVVALIGPKWGSVRDPSGGPRRLESEWDYVRREITAALDVGATLIPIVLPGGELPALAGLPDEMQSLGELQALTLSTRHWEEDTAELIDAIRVDLERKDSGLALRNR